MERYISTNKLMNNMVTFVSPKLAQSIIKAVDETPTEEVTPIVRGKWIKEECTKTTDLFRCSRCGRSILLCKGSLLKDYPYCHCGAKMEESEEEE